MHTIKRNVCERAHACLGFFENIIFLLKNNVFFTLCIYLCFTLYKQGSFYIEASTLYLIEFHSLPYCRCVPLATGINYETYGRQK